MTIDGFCMDNRKRIKMLTKSVDESIFCGMLDRSLYKTKPDNKKIRKMIRSLMAGLSIKFGKNDVSIEVGSSGVYYNLEFVGDCGFSRILDVDFDFALHALLEYARVNTSLGRGKILSQMTGCNRGMDSISIYYGFDCGQFRSFALNSKSLLISDFVYSMSLMPNFEAALWRLYDTIKKLCVGDVLNFGNYVILRMGDYIVLMLGESQVPYEYFMCTAHPYRIADLKIVFDDFVENYNVMHLRMKLL